MTETSDAWALRVHREARRVAMERVRELVAPKLASSIKALRVTLGRVTWYGELDDDVRVLAMDDQDPDAYGAGDRDTIANMSIRVRVAVPVMLTAKMRGERRGHRHVDSVAVVDVEGWPPKVTTAVLLDRHTAGLAGDVAGKRGARVHYRRVVMRRVSIAELMAAGEESSETP